MALVFAGCATTVEDERRPARSDTGGGGTGGGSASSGVGGDTEPACAAFDNEKGTPVTVRLRNESGETIYLAAECEELTSLVVPVEPNGLAYYEPVCTCSTVQLQGELACIAAGCVPSALRLLPGETREVVWSGTAMKKDELPAGCVEGQESGAACERRVKAPAQAHRVGVKAFSSCAGNAGEPGCTCAANGICEGGAIGVEGYYESPTFNYPAQTVVDVIFPVCTFPCAGP